MRRILRRVVTTARSITARKAGGRMNNRIEGLGWLDTHGDRVCLTDMLVNAGVLRRALLPYISRIDSGFRARVSDSLPALEHTSVFARVTVTRRQLRPLCRVFHET